MIAAEQTRFAALLNAIPPIGKIRPISKIAVTFEPTIIFDILAQTLVGATPPINKIHPFSKKKLLFIQ